MKKSRFTETQIVSILKKADVGVLVRISAASTASPTRPTTTGSPSAAAWKLRPQAHEGDGLELLSGDFVAWAEAAGMMIH